MEIEKKYLLRENGRDYATDGFFILYPDVNSAMQDVLKLGRRIQQGYVPVSAGIEIAKMLEINLDFTPVEVRLRKVGPNHYLTLKGEGGISREDAECEISSDVFKLHWDATNGRRVIKIRLEKPYDGYTLEIDVYTDRNLMVAEIELPDLKSSRSIIPVGLDITEVERYKNRNLAK